MFTGLIEEVGTVRRMRRHGNSLRLEITCSTVLDGLRTGDSISIEGACQTVVSVDKTSFAVDTLGETLRKTSLGGFNTGSPVNLERALRVGDRLGGHLVQGHVDGTGTIRQIERSDRNVYIDIEIPARLLRYCVSEGSIAVDGISLTIASMTKTGVRLNIIPETWQRTSLKHRSVGDAVNIETDLVARYVERLLPGNGAGHGGTTETFGVAELARWGYGGQD